MISDLLQSYWAIKSSEVNQIYKSCWEIDGKYVLKIGDNINQLNRNLIVLNELARKKIPVAKVIQTISGSEYIIEDNKYYFLSEKIDGEHITNIYEQDYRELSYNMGITIANLHQAFIVCQQTLECWDNDFLSEIDGWVLDTLNGSKANYVSENVLQFIEANLSELYPKLPRQLIHRDLHMGNMIFKKGELTGYIDFDLSQINARVFDLCHFALSFLIDNVKSIEKTNKWFDILLHIFEGYNSLNQLKVEEIRSVPTMMLSIELLFISYFINQGELDFAQSSADILNWIWEQKINIENVLADTTKTFV